MTNLPFVIRDATPSDRGFIEKSWEATMRAAPDLRWSDPGHYHGEMRRVFDILLHTPGSTVRVACSPSDPDTLGGFIAATGPELHYAYVAHDFRKFGLVPMMLEGLAIKRFTFSTPYGVRRLKPRDRGWAYTPRWTL